VVHGPEALQQRQYGICKEDFLGTIFPAAGPILVYVALILLQPGPWDLYRYSMVAAAIVRRRSFVGNGWP